MRAYPEGKILRATGPARRAARREATAPYNGDGMEGGAIARMLEDGDGAAYMVKTSELEARAESEAQSVEFEGGEDGEEDASKPNFSALTAAEMAGGKVIIPRGGGGGKEEERQRRPGQYYCNVW